MKSLPLMQKVSRLFHQKRMFWRILVLYLAGSILLLTIFSGVLTVYLTWQATRETISRNNDALGQAYAAADYILNTAYETYYKMYQSYEATDILFADTPTTDAALTAAKLFKQINTGIDCVESVYFVTEPPIGSTPAMVALQHWMNFTTRRPCGCSNSTTKIPTHCFCPVRPPFPMPPVSSRNTVTSR